MPDHHVYPAAGLLRRLAACIYDALLVLALWVIPASLLMMFRGGEPIPPGNPLLQLTLLVTTAAFFVGFWIYGGQTLGMRAWRLRVERENGAPITIAVGIVRFLTGILSFAAAGLGMLWILVDPQKRAWHDYASGTRVVLLPPGKSGTRP